MSDGSSSLCGSIPTTAASIGSLLPSRTSAYFFCKNKQHRQERRIIRDEQRLALTWVRLHSSTFSFLLPLLSLFSSRHIRSKQLSCCVSLLNELYLLGFIFWKKIFPSALRSFKCHVFECLKAAATAFTHETCRRKHTGGETWKIDWGQHLSQ